MTAEKFIPELTFGERLAIARKRAGLSQSQIAERIKIGKAHSPASEASIAKWETDGGRPRELFDVVAQWSEITNVREDWLIFGNEITVRSTLSSQHEFSKPPRCTQRRVGICGPHKNCSATNRRSAPRSTRS